MRHSRILALHCGASHVAFGLFPRGPGPLTPERCAARPIDAGDGTAERWLAAACAALRELVREENLRGGCVVGLPGHLTSERTFEVPAAAARQRRKIIAFEQRRAIAAAEEAGVWSHALVAGARRGREMILAAAKRRMLEELGARIREAGLYPEAAIPAWLVLRHAIRDRLAPAGDALVLSVGAWSSRLVFCRADGFSARTLPVGGGMVTQKLAEELQIDPAAAEALKRRGFEGAAGAPAAARERAAGRMAADLFVRRLSGEILGSPPLYPDIGDAPRPEVLWLTGGGAQLGGLRAALAESLRMRVEPWEPRAPSGPGRAAPDSRPAPDEAWLIDLVGLAACAGKPARREGNLLPAPFRREMFVRRRWPWLAAAALLAVAAVLAPAWRMRACAREARRQSAAMDAAVAASRLAEARNLADLARLAGASRQIAALRKLARARSGWPALFSELQERFAGVEDVWLDRLQIAAPGPGEPPVATGVRLLIAGNLLDADRLAAGAPGGTSPKTALLMASLEHSPLVAAVESEQFFGSQPGIWDFEIILRLTPDALP